jgi:hypothetical protein
MPQRLSGHFDDGVSGSKRKCAIHLDRRLTIFSQSEISRTQKPMRFSTTCVAARDVRAVHREEDTRDDVLGGIPTTAIAGLFPSFTYQVEATTPPQVSSVQN